MLKIWEERELEDGCGSALEYMPGCLRHFPIGAWRIGARCSLYRFPIRKHIICWALVSWSLVEADVGTSDAFNVLWISFPLRATFNIFFCRQYSPSKICNCFISSFLFCLFLLVLIFLMDSNIVRFCKVSV